MKENSNHTRELLHDDPSLQRASQLVDKSQVEKNGPLTEDAMNRTWSRIEDGMKKQSGRRMSLTIRRWSVAASLAALFALGGFLGHQLWSKPDMLVVMNEGKEALLFTLPDESQVWLGGGAVLRYPDKLSGQDRKVYLEGEAFFDVKKDNGRTFQVLTNIVEVTVLGTRFDVRVSDKGQLAEVVLESGSVKLNQNNTEGEGVILRPGEMGRVKQRGDIQVHHVNLQLYTTWKDKYLNIESQEMESVMFMLSKRYHTNITIKGDKLKEEIFSGRFDIEQTLENIFETIDQMTPIRYQRQPDGSYLVTPK